MARILLIILKQILKNLLKYIDEFNNFCIW
jgi:hypothetical protein